MTTEQDSTPDARRRGGRKPYPVLNLETALVLARGIETHSIEGKIRRLTLFQEMNRSPNSGPSRLLIANAAKYGLSNGNYSSEFLELTDNGRKLVNGDPRQNRETLQLLFETAIGSIELFNAIYEQLRNQRIPSDSVMNDLIGQHGVAVEDRGAVASIIIDNLHYLGLVTDVSGTEYVLPFEQVLEEARATSVTSRPSTASEIGPAENGVDEPVASPVAIASDQRSIDVPNVHIDVQIHIDASAEADQIDQIFASMAKHLYGGMRD